MVANGSGHQGQLVNKVRRVNPTFFLLCRRTFLSRGVRVSGDGVKGLWSLSSFSGSTRSPGWVTAENTPGFSDSALSGPGRNRHRW